MTFAATFRELVMPDLRTMCRTQGLFVALDLQSFTEASAAVMHHACMRGASKLPPHLLPELEEWIDTLLLEQIDSHAATADAVFYFANHPDRCGDQWPVA